jgi:hypothetical protein
MYPSAPYWGVFNHAYQGFVAQSNAVSFIGVTVGTPNYQAGSSPTALRIRLCRDSACNQPMTERTVPIVNYGNTEADFGDVAVTPGATYYVVWYQPPRWNGQTWDTFWWAGSTGPSGRRPVEESDQMQMVVSGYNR